MTRREKNKYNKAKSTNNLAKQVIVVTEGSKTEPEYLKELKKFNLDGKSLKVRIFPGKGGNIKELIEKMKYIIATRFELKPGDEAWIVVDDDERDSKTISKLLDWQKTDPMLNKLAGSNPLFEYWLLLHFENGNAVIGKEDCVSRLVSHLKTELKDRKFRYKKEFPKKLITLDRIKDAFERAKERDKVAIDKWPELRNTRVYKLVETILGRKLDDK